MAWVCQICGRKPSTGNMIVRRGLAKKKGGVGRKITGITKRRFKPNLQSVRAVIDGKTKRIKVCTRCISAGKIIKPMVVENK
ncbi:MAG: 50S ribosomal protein L28 [Planctomycetota bacterium]|nr:50S ribosomal protein L28 [Planctomycetota bacterium]MDI6786747.1 50S ribosomal protein L28 [Planctomycetota bacterium]